MDFEHFLKGLSASVGQQPQPAPPPPPPLQSQPSQPVHSTGSADMANSTTNDRQNSGQNGGSQGSSLLADWFNWLVLKPASSLLLSLIKYTNDIVRIFPVYLILPLFPFVDSLPLLLLGALPTLRFETLPSLFSAIERY